MMMMMRLLGAGGMGCDRERDSTDWRGLLSPE